MQHFTHIPATRRAALFAREPQRFSARDEPQHVGAALGATLYMPGTRPALADDIIAQHAQGLVSTVWCLEDSISSGDVPAAEENIARQLSGLAERFPTPEVASGNLPLIFVRVREPEQIDRLITGVRAAGDDVRASEVLTGFVLPKFTAANAVAYFAALDRASTALGYRLLAMPVIETPEVVHGETRSELLTSVAAVLQARRDVVACIRIGGTDLGAALGLRRPREQTIYQIGPVAEVIYAIINVFNRTDGTGYPVSGPVWEYFADSRRLFKPQLRETPFRALDHNDIRAELLEENLDGLVRELALDRANGLVGKTVIHPQHVGIVHALSVVSDEEYQDAMDVVGKDASGGGVSASRSGNKMNEAGPHLGWAMRTLARADAFGVAAPGYGMVDFLLAHVESLAEQGESA